VLQTTAGKMIFGRYIEAPPAVQTGGVGPAPVPSSGAVSSGPAAKVNVK
jgi:hypothetical protein